MKTDLNELIKNNPRCEVELYSSARYKSDPSALHTDSCKFICFAEDPFFKKLKSKDIESFSLLSAEDYNSSINANCSPEQEDPAIVVVITDEAAEKYVC